MENTPKKLAAEFIGTFWLVLGGGFTLLEDGRLLCALCCSILAHANSFKRHMQTVHLKQKNYPCGACGKLFSEKGNAKKHERKCLQQQNN